MKSKNVVKLLTFLTVLGIIALFGAQVNSQTVNIFAESIEARPSAPDITPEAYDGPQTVKALMNAFDTAYNQKFSKAKVIAIFGDGVVYSSELAIRGEIDARHSRVEWLHMLLQRGVTIEDFDDYRIYLSKRHTLAFLEDNPDLRKIGFRGMPLTDDLEAYKVAYIDKLVAKRIEDHKKQVERAKKRIESAKERIARAKKQPSPKQVEHARKQIAQATKQLRRAQAALERFQNPTLPPQKLKWNRIRKSSYPAL
ncbi:MAG: hypothetical protein OXH00_25115 [Candidatus Poribacteria bacterium]|nr:hypothetical protein [Candidatus Poribacteria bacterium]